MLPTSWCPPNPPIPPNPHPHPDCESVSKSSESGQRMIFQIVGAQGPKTLFAEHGQSSPLSRMVVVVVLVLVLVLVVVT